VIDLGARFRLVLPVRLQCLQRYMFLFGTETYNIMLNSVFTDVYSLLLQFIPLAVFISLSQISPNEYVYFAARYVVWDAVWNSM
jgi:hypothetical protein